MNQTSISGRQSVGDKVRLLLCATVIFSMALVAETASAQGMIIYPAKGQSQSQQDKDKYECHSWAVQQSGYDPSNPQAAAPASSSSQQSPTSQRPVLKGAGRGAALGAVGGAIAGDAGKGAAAGAAMGGVAGGFRRRDARKQQAAQQQESQSAQSSQAAAYQRAMGACLEGRGYTVK